MSHTIITYLSFSGECEQAVRAYIDAFGGQILFLSRWDENNCETEAQIGKVMHTEFLLGETRMAAGDTFDRDVPNRAVKLMIHMDDEAAAHRGIEILCAGGTVISGLSPHPAPDDSGMGGIVTDRFGYTWIITCPNPNKQNNRKHTAQQPEESRRAVFCWQ